MYIISQRDQGFFICDGHTSISLDKPGHFKALKNLADNPQVLFVGHDMKPLLKKLLSYGVAIKRPVCLKTLIKLGVLEEGAVSLEYREIKQQLSEAFKAIEAQGMQKVARLESLVLPVVAAMEHKGLYIDQVRLKAYQDAAQERLHSARQLALEALAGALNKNLFGEAELNLDSGLEVKDALEKTLGYALSGTSHDVLNEINHPAAKALIAYREAAKILSTYGEAFAAHINPSTSRIHATFEPLGAGTGRMSCHDPNLQNLPSDKVFHEAIRAPAGYQLITADYAGCELRILAGLSGDKAFIAAFERGADLHAEVASKLFKVSVTKSENTHLRQQAKAINFGLMYGMGAPSLARQLGLMLHEAEDLLKDYFAAFPSIRDFLEHLVSEALQKGYAQTVIGRRLYFDEAILNGPNPRRDIGRIARNMPIQGTAADMVKLAMVYIHDKISKDTNAALVNMIHDELVLESKTAAAHGVADLVKSEMQAAAHLMVPAVPHFAEVHIGQSWGH